jgi:hypothetical protein
VLFQKRSFILAAAGMQNVDEPLFGFIAERALRLFFWHISSPSVRAFAG